MSDFFKDVKDYEVTYTFYGCERRVSAEDMYQAFKERLNNELCAESHSIPKLHFDTLYNFIIDNAYEIEFGKGDLCKLKGLLDFMELVKYEQT